ncbi:hypothetical protein Leryth_012161 [Lithospermum erythrorhizon]|nr:hypothetical protein Leryth_012161 [Lithospermum erythrorhizon]
MDFGVAEQNVDIYGNDEDGNEYEDEDYPQEQEQHKHPDGDYGENVVDNSAGHHFNHSFQDSSVGKLFVGGIAWETSKESFTRYFAKFGQITDSVIMMDKVTGRPRGFGFVTFASSEAANKVLQEDHVIDGRMVEVKRTVPREDMQTKGVLRTKKIFVGGLPLSLSEEDLKEYFSSYGEIIEYQIMLDHTTGRSRGFGFVTFEHEDSVDRIFSDGRMHELDGKKVEIKRAEPKRAGFDHGNDNRMRRGSSSSRSYGGSGGDSTEFGGGYGGKMGRGYGGYSGYGSYGAYGNYPGGFGGSAAGFYAGYGGYGFGFGFGGPMYGGAAYGGGGYGAPAGYGVAGAYGVGSGGGGKAYGASGYYGGREYEGGGGAGGYNGGRGYGGTTGGGGNKGYGGSGAASGRFHPYRK